MADLRKAAGQADVEGLSQDKSGIELLAERLKNGLYGLLFVLGKDTALSPIWILIGEIFDFVSDLGRGPVLSGGLRAKCAGITHLSSYVFLSGLMRG